LDPVHGNAGAFGARDLLALVCGWFTDSFDTADVEGTKALFDKLGCTSGFGLWAAC
jgi:hypothetical protein